VRLSPNRLLLRAVLLILAGGLAMGRALEDGRKAADPGLDAGLALFHSRVALAEWILAGLALLTALAALAALRRPSRRRLLRLGEHDPGGAEAPVEPSRVAPREPPG